MRRVGRAAARLEGRTFQGHHAQVCAIVWQRRAHRPPPRRSWSDSRRRSRRTSPWVHPAHHRRGWHRRAGRRAYGRPHVWLLRVGLLLCLVADAVAVPLLVLVNERTVRIERLSEVAAGRCRGGARRSRRPPRRT